MKRKMVNMSTSLPFSSPVLNNILSEVFTSSNTYILECFGQLQLLDHKLINLQSTKETGPGLKSKQTELEHTKTREHEKLKLVDETRLNKNKTENELDRYRQRIIEI